MNQILSMSIERVFLGWNSPCLHLAVKYLLRVNQSDENLNLQNQIIAVPSNRAGRKILELLAKATTAAGLFFTPPKILTTGSLIDSLCEIDEKTASKTERICAWAEALRQTPNETRKAIIPSPPEAKKISAWISLGEEFDSLWNSLAASGKSPELISTELKDKLENNESLRWIAFAEIYNHYLEALKTSGNIDLHSQRLIHLQKTRNSKYSHIYLVACSDLNEVAKQCLSTTSDNITALIHAPKEFEDHFDAYACLISSKWKEQPIKIQESIISPCNSYELQGHLAANVIAHNANTYGPNAITIGMADEQLADNLQSSLGKHSISSRKAVNKTLAHSSPAIFLRSALQFTASQTYETFSSLIRHPDVEKWLSIKFKSPIEICDRYYEKHLPFSLNTLSTDNSSNTATIRDILKETQQLLSPLQSKSNCASDNAGKILQILSNLYSEISRSSETDEAISGICNSLESLSNSSAGLLCEFSAFLHLLEIELGQAIIQQPLIEEAVELLGWLEVQLDDAPALIICGANEGIIPQSITSHSFLPDSTRKYLGLTDNDQRYARDAYALSASIHSRKVLSIIFSKTSATGDPLSPSRLLLSTNRQNIATRIIRLSEPNRQNINFKECTAGFNLHQPLPLETPPKTVNVSGLRDYISCPYRYYLKTYFTP